MSTDPDIDFGASVAARAGYKVLRLHKSTAEDLLTAFKDLADGGDCDDERHQISRDELDDILTMIDFKLSAEGRERDLDIIMAVAGGQDDDPYQISKIEFETFLDIDEKGRVVAWSPEWYPSSSGPWVLFANELLQPYHIPACLRKPLQHAPGGEPLKTKFQKWAFLKKSVGAWHRGDIATLEAVNAAYVLDIYGLQLPFFLSLMSCIQVAIHLYIDHQIESNQLGVSAESVLAYRPCCRVELWRWVSSSLVHADWGHLLCNMALQWVAGLYLEIINGPKAMLKLYVFGALAAALLASIMQPTATVVGASGAVFAICGAAVAHAAINWDTMGNFKYWLAFVQFFILVPYGWSFYSDAIDPAQTVSWSAHIGGFVFGVLYGWCALENSAVTELETYMAWFGFSFAASGIIFGGFYNVLTYPDVDCETSQHCTYN